MSKCLLRTYISSTVPIRPLFEKYIQIQQIILKKKKKGKIANTLNFFNRGSNFLIKKKNMKSTDIFLFKLLVDCVHFCEELQLFQSFKKSEYDNIV